jgi:hypothetical protein
MTHERTTSALVGGAAGHGSGGHVVQIVRWFTMLGAPSRRSQMLGFLELVKRQQDRRDDAITTPIAVLR